MDDNRVLVQIGKSEYEIILLIDKLQIEVENSGLRKDHKEKLAPLVSDVRNYLYQCIGARCFGLYEAQLKREER